MIMSICLKKKKKKTQEKRITHANEFNEWIIKNEKYINEELFKKIL